MHLLVVVTVPSARAPRQGSQRQGQQSGQFALTATQTCSSSMQIFELSCRDPCRRQESRLRMPARGSSRMQPWSRLFLPQLEQKNPFLRERNTQYCCSVAEQCLGPAVLLRLSTAPQRWSPIEPRLDSDATTKATTMFVVDKERVVQTVLSEF